MGGGLTLRILHVIDASGSTGYFRDIAEYHDGGSFPVVIGSLAAQGGLQAAMSSREIPTFALGLKARNPRNVVGLAREIRRLGADVVHAHCFWPTLWGLFAARLTKRPFVFTRHHSDHHQRLGKAWPVWVDSWCARRADAVIAVSHATAEIMTRHEAVPARLIEVVHNGARPPATPPGTIVERLRQELNPGADPVLCVPARLHEEKGHAVLLHALARLGAENLRPIALLAGAGDARAIIALSKAIGVSEQIRILGFRPDLAALMTLADVVVVPSLAESFGFVALEAMALARPLIVSDAGGLPEVVESGVSGLVVPRADVGRLASAIALLLREPDKGLRLGTAGPSRAARFSPQRMMAGYERVYRRWARV